MTSLILMVGFALASILRASANASQWISDKLTVKAYRCMLFILGVLAAVIDLGMR
jgi:hypothetical protein